MRPLVRIPRSVSRRGAFDGAQLIRRIVRGRLGAFRLEGEFLPPGKIVPESALWPGPDWPQVPHLIEIFHSDQSRAGHGGSRIDVILWRYESNDWREICRFNGYDSSAWIEQMEPVIAQSLKESRPAPAPDVHAMVDELVAPIAAQFGALESREHREALATELFTRMMWIMCDVKGGEAAG